MSRDGQVWWCPRCRRQWSHARTLHAATPARRLVCPRCGMDLTLAEADVTPVVGYPIPEEMREAS